MGMPYAGTNVLASSLSRHSKVAVFHETFFWGRGYLQPRPNGCYDFLQVHYWIEGMIQKARHHAEIYGDLDADRFSKNLEDWYLHLPELPKPAAVYRQTLQIFAQVQGKPFAVEETVYDLFAVTRILDALPGARIVLAVEGIVGFFTHDKNRGDGRSFSSGCHYRSRYHPALLAAYWEKAIREIYGTAEAYPEQILLISRGDIAREPVKTLEKVQRFFLLEPEDSCGPQPPSPPAGPWQGNSILSHDDIFWMQQAAGETKVKEELTRLGVYPKRLNRGRVFLSLCSLPGAWFYNRSTSRKILKQYRTA